MKKEPQNTVRNRLIQATYIHSNTDNFVAQSLEQFKLKDNFKLKFEIEQSLAQLQLIIQSIINQCNSFYQDVGLLNSDFISYSTPRKIEYHLDGAKAFANKFLQRNNLDELQQSDTLSTKLLTLMNNPFFQKDFQKDLRNIDKSKDSIARETFEDFCLATNKNFSKKVLSNIQNYSGTQALKLIDETVDKLFETVEYGNTGKTKFRFKKRVENRLLKTTVGQDLLNEVTLQGKLSLTRSEDVRKIKEKIKKKYKISYNPKIIAESLLKVLRNFDIDKMLPQDEQFDEIFLTFYERKIKEYLDMNLDIKKYSSHFQEFILEETATLSLMDIANLGDKLVKDVSSVGNTYMLKTMKINDQTITKMVRRSSDIQITGNSGKTYLIECKNSFESEDELPIRLQGSIKVKNYAETVLSPEKAKEFEYYILNAAYLSKYGLNKKGFSNPYDGKIDEYIQYFLDLTLSYLIAGKVKQELYTHKTQYTGNVFFIYQGKYLIPSSLFLVTVYNHLLLLLDTDNLHSTLNTFGYLNYDKELTGWESSMEEAKKIRTDKLYTVKNFWAIQHEVDYDRDLSMFYKYPDPMVSIGSKKGQEMLNNARFKNIHFYSKIMDIKQLLR